MGNVHEGLRLGIHQARAMFLQSQPKHTKQPDPTVQRDLKPGWLLHYLFPLDSLLWNRWDYWADVQEAPTLPNKPLPRLDYVDSFLEAAPGRKMLSRCLNAVANENLNGDGWMGWSSFRYFDYFLNWLLFGFGHPGYEELPEEETPGASMRLYQLFDLSPLLLWPHDHLGDMLAECRHGRHNGFYPTPHTVCEMMVQMIMDGEDMRSKTVCDPACGTGRMLLHAANHSLRLYGQDIDATMCKSTLVNGYLYAPWLSRPIWWLDRARLMLGDALAQHQPQSMNDGGDLSAEAREECSAVIQTAQQRSDQMTSAAPPHYQAQLFDTEFDAEGTAKTAPILKRKKRTGTSSSVPVNQLNLMEV